MKKNAILLTFLLLHLLSSIFINLGAISEFIDTYPLAKKIGLDQIAKTGSLICTKLNFLSPYQVLTGTDTGYCFFSPNVPHPFFMRFDVFIPNQEKQTQLAKLSTEEGTSRINSAVFSIKDEKQVDDIIARSFAVRVAENNPSADSVKVILGYIFIPSVTSVDRQDYHIINNRSFSFTLNH